MQEQEPHRHWLPYVLQINRQPKAIAAQAESKLIFEVKETKSKQANIIIKKDAKRHPS